MWTSSIYANFPNLAVVETIARIFLRGHVSEGWKIQQADTDTSPRSTGAASSDRAHFSWQAATETRRRPVAAAPIRKMPLVKRAVLAIRGFNQPLPFLLGLGDDHRAESLSARRQGRNSLLPSEGARPRRHRLHGRGWHMPDNITPIFLSRWKRVRSPARSTLTKTD